jgi:glycerol-3-phosphate acyltransferase PlsX
MLPIAVDAMGGDHAPGAIVAGARAAAAAGTPIVLVGPPDLGDRVDIGELALITAGEVIEMDEDGGRAVRRKKDSTLVRAAEAVRDGTASAMISAGNTGATMASALLRMGRIAGVNRPAIATVLPVPGGQPTVLLDAGANAEVQPEWLVQFAHMGAIFTRHRFGVATPKVGLLSIGEEPGKGDSLRKEVYYLLEGAVAEANVSRFDFVGNVEGRDILTDAADVVVTDGFTGNVVLKTLEGSLRVVVNGLLEAFGSSPEYQQHADALMPAMLPLYTSLDPETYGGAMLLGVDGVCIIAHGSSSERAVLNAINLAREMVEGDVVGEISRAIRPA